MAASSIESLAVQACGCVDDVERLRIKVGRNDNVVCSKIAWALGLNAFLVNMNVNTRVKLSEGNTGNLGSVFSNNVLIVRDTVKKSQRTDTSKNQVLGDLVGKGFDGDEKNVCALDLGLSSHAPEANLAIIESNLLCGVLESAPAEWRYYWEAKSLGLAI
ncbi:hypothetical protein HG531_003004 [Fusarium graminearum]|nr:hypothetical protein HG531_003004 [Fusarium graminearum]